MSTGNAAPTPESAEYLPIGKLAEGDFLRGQVCRVEGAQIRTSRKNGNSFLVGQLADASGRVDFIAFDLGDAGMDAVRAAALVRVAGEAASFDSRLQVRVSRIEPVTEPLSDADHGLLFARTGRDVDAMLADVRAWLEAAGNPCLRAIAAAYLDDDELMRAFREAPAATSNHHAWIGGLLEHTWEMLRMARGILAGPGSERIAEPLFADVDRDIVMLSVFLHDLSKVEELRWDGEFRYTRRGNLVGHLVGGAIELDRRVRDLRDADGRPVAVPPAVLDVLQHILISHHGRPEHGAARIPATPEAIFVAYLDDLAAKMSTVLAAAARAGNSGRGGEFTERHWSLETRIYRPNPFDDASDASGATASG
jgi:3'-5' exoribonuclease